MVWLSRIWSEDPVILKIVKILDQCMTDFGNQLSLSRISPYYPGCTRFIELLSSTGLILMFMVSGTWPDCPGHGSMTQLFRDLSKSYTSPWSSLEIQLTIPDKPSLSGICPIYWDFELYGAYFVIFDIRDMDWLSRTWIDDPVISRLVKILHQSLDVPRDSAQYPG